MKSQKGIIILGGLYFLAGALAIGTFAAVDVKSNDKAEAVADGRQDAKAQPIADGRQDAKAQPIADAVNIPTLDVNTVATR